MKSLLVLLAFIGFASPLLAEVPRSVPDFTWTDSSGAAKKSRDLRGRPLVVLIAPKPSQWTFRSQVGQLNKIYQRLAAEGLVCVAAFSEESGVVRTNIPFLTVPDGANTAAAFNVTKGFAIAVIGRDGNIDSIGDRVLPAQRILDIINNSYAKQKMLRRE